MEPEHAGKGTVMHGKNRIMIYGPRIEHHRIQDSRGRGFGDERAGALIILATVISVVYWVGR
jgi:hypothetical protein